MREINVSRLTVALCLAAGFGALTGKAIAQDAYCGGPMAWGDANEVALATVTDAAPRTHFIAGRTPSRPECPSPQSSCRLKAFLVPGDQVLAEKGGVETFAASPSAPLRASRPAAFCRPAP